MLWWMLCKGGLKMYAIAEFNHGAAHDALSVMRRAAEHLVQSGKTLWDPLRLTSQIFDGLTAEEILVGYIHAEPVAAMVLPWRDAELWPDAQPGTSRFIHKLAVVPAYQGAGLGVCMLAKAVAEAKATQADYLRLDCAGDRPRLCNFYESFGFIKVREGFVGPYFSAFYEFKVSDFPRC